MFEPSLTIGHFNLSGTHQNVTLEEGTYDITCHVTGGWPDVTNTSVTCGGVAVASRRVRLGLDMHGANCTCRGRHASGCYDLETWVLLAIVEEGTS